MTQSIIVYRNPVEQAFWEGLMNSELTFPVMFAVAMFFVSIFFYDWLLNKIQDAFKVRRVWNGQGYMVVALSTITSLCVLWYML